MKSRIRQGVERTISRLPLSGLLSMSGVDVLSLFYHKVEDSSPPYFRANYLVKTPKEFEKELDWLLHRFRPIALPDLIAAASSGTSIPSNSLFLSFDDGYRELAEIVGPILSRKGVPATFFITTDLIDNENWFFEDEIGYLVGQFRQLSAIEQSACVERCLQPEGLDIDSLQRARRRPAAALDRLWEWLNLDREEKLRHFKPYLTSDQISSLLNEGFSFGAHGVDHSVFGDLSLNEQLNQVEASVSRLVRSFGLGYRAFAFPYGEFGVSRKFFMDAKKRNLVDVFFGTRGLLADEFHPFVRQRFWCENHKSSLKTHLRFGLAEAALRGFRSLNKVRRDA